MRDRIFHAFRRYFVIIPLFFVFVSKMLVSCEPELSSLGVDMFPASDSIFVYTDTIRDFETKLVKSQPRITSLNSATASDQRVFLLGNRKDTITGYSQADIVAQMSITRRGVFGDDPYIDSLQLWFYIADVEGDTATEIRLKVHELTDRIYYDSTYYSDHDISGMYNEVPLINDVIVPKPGTLYKLDITDEDYISRILDAARDTVFNLNSLFQDTFYGFYFTTEPVIEGGAIAKLQLANDICGLQFRYLHDSVLIDTAKESNYGTYATNFHEWYSQKINLFSHNYEGTHIQDLIGQPDANSTIGYAQGMAGVNFSISLPDIQDYLNLDTVAINAAKILFYVLPDSISGISQEDYPGLLMMKRIDSDGQELPLYDYITATDSHYFGKLTQSNEQSAFLEPLYFYNFQIGRHLQSVFSAEIENNDLIIYVNQPTITSKTIKFWSNHSGNKGSLRLELIYTKL